MERLHANTLRLADHGVLITGPSGSGKSVLTLALIERAPLFKRSSALIADDYSEITAQNGHLIARAPARLKGGMEIRGAGLFEMPHEEQTKLDLAVLLGGDAARYPTNATFSCLGIELRQLNLPPIEETDILALCQALEASLFKKPWQPPF